MHGHQTIPNSRRLLRNCTFLAAVLFSISSFAGVGRADDWPQWLGPQRDGVWRETGIVTSFPATGPEFRWKAKIGAGYASPAVVGDRVYVTDRILARGAQNPASAFARDSVNGNEGVSCLDDKTGAVIWRHEYLCPYEVSYASGPRCTPVVQDGRVYTLGTMGDLLCLDAETGKVVWSVNFVRDRGARVPQWGFAAHPLLEGNKLICLVGGEKGLAVAFDKDTGKEIWHALSSKETGYCPPMIYQMGGKRELIIWSPEAVTALEPESGRTIWTQPWKIQDQSSMAISTPRYLTGKLFLTCFYNGSLLLGIDPSGDQASIIWHGKWFEKPRMGSELTANSDGLQSIISTPVLTADTIYGVCSFGQLRAIDLKTGKRLWETFAATSGKEDRWGNAFLVQHEDRYFLFSEKGDLIMARLSREGYNELGRMHLIEPDNRMPGRRVVWSHPAFAHRNVYVRNDQEIVSVSLAAKP
jgi:outer membrane protein assembly factor BamB